MLCDVPLGPPASFFFSFFLSAAALLAAAAVGGGASFSPPTPAVMPAAPSALGLSFFALLPRLTLM